MEASPCLLRVPARRSRRWLAFAAAVIVLLGGGWLAQAQTPAPTPTPASSPTPRPTSTARPSGSPAAASVEDVMWAGLIFADVAGPDPTVKGGELKILGHWPAPLVGRERQISKIFGYRRLHLLGQARERIRSGTEDWALRSKPFVVKMDTRKPTKRGYEVLVQLLQDEKLLVEVTVDLPRTSSPLYIKGPLVNSGQLIIAVICGSKDAAWTKPRPRTTPRPTVTPTVAPEPTPAVASPNTLESPAASPAPTPAATP